MSKELVISANRHETKVALIEDDQLCEVYFQRANEYSLAGSIHKGRVTRVLPGMQSAFVDLGLERDTFLYVSDFLEEHEDFDKVTGDERPARESRDERPARESREDRPVRESRDDRPVREFREDRPPRESRDREPREGRDREGREFRRPPQAPPAPAPVAESTETAASALLGPASPPSEPRSGDRGPDRGGDRGGDQGDRRGRRSRRRRNGGRGFPDSKYASAGGAEHRQSGPPSGFRQPAAPVERQETDAAESEELLPEQTSEEITPLILPGESLRKYRDTPPAALSPGMQQMVSLLQENRVELEEMISAEPAHEPEPVEEFDEPIHYPAENALPDAPVHREVLPEAVLEAAPIAPPPLPEEYVAAHQPPQEVQIDAAPAESSIEEEDAAEEAAEENEGGPAIAPGLDEEEDRDIQAMILGDIDGIDTIEEGSEESSTAAESAPAPESGTASVRERSGRFPHRGSRRNRRRRGGPGGPALGQDTPKPEQNLAEPPASEAIRPEFVRPQQQIVSRPTQGQPSISDLLKEGQEIIVQIAKEPLGQKGARITSHIALPGRYVVYMPTLEHMGVSRKIGSDEERLRLKRILQAKRPGPVGGFITRTAAEGRSEEDIAGDMQFLYNLWQDIKTRADKRSAPMLLHHDLDIVQRILRDQLADSFKAIWIDNEEHYESVLRFVERFQPALVPKVKLYTREAPIFDAFGVTAELEKALRPKVWLKSGGYIVINQTEALVAIDVNTGKYVGKSNRLEDTIVKTNTEAIKEIVRQTRLRDLGGIIVIDFIDMDERKNRQKVMQALEEAMRADRAPYKILQFNDFGLVAITRKRVKQSLERTLCSPCPHCEGAGYVKSVQTVVSEILTEARKMARTVDSKDVMLRVHPDVAKLLKSHQNKFLEELEEILRRPVLVKSDPLLHHEKFDLA
ncbi:MAG: Rne/Rng family ribonuclease [Bryobacteraceae bacterium]